MDILPAIDLRDGRCVRLLQGDYARQIDYNHDPVSQGRLFAADGGRWLHIVDLDGARDGRQHNLSAISAIAEATGLKIELGGGIRTAQTVEMLLCDYGISRVVIGTMALEQPSLFQELVYRYPHRIVLGLDARCGQLSTRGWTHTATTTVLQMAQLVSGWPIAAIVYTDISRDGMMNGPAIESTAALAESTDISVIASGGVATLAHIGELSALSIAGIIVGRALYEGNFTLKQAIEAAAIS